MESSQSSRPEVGAARLPATVRVATIERELARLWSDAERLDEAHPPLRPRTANLIVAISDPGALWQSDEIAARIAARHPGRAIVVGPDPGAERLQAAVAVHCPISPGGRVRLCSEVVTLAGPPSSLDEAHSAVAGLLVPDLPTFLWWRRSVPTTERLYVMLARLADCLVVDSRTFFRPDEGLRWLVQAVESNRVELDLADLEWGRLTSWRELIARAFRAPDTRAVLDALTSVTIHYVDDGSRPCHPLPSSASLLVGWLASRLNWRSLSTFTVEQSRGWYRQYEHAHGQVSVRAVPGPFAELSTSEIVGIELESDGVEPVRVTIAREPDRVCVSTSVIVGGQLVRRQVSPIATPSAHELVAMALDSDVTDPIFRDALIEAAAR